jgi:Ca2+:H+ antiporter
VKKPLNWLLVFIPIALFLRWTKQDPIFVFAASALAIVPLAALMGDATEALAEFLGPTWGGLLNATLGNAPEIIISIFALQDGLVEIVKSSLTGSILGNLLFGMGLSMFAAGIKNPKEEQKFDPKVARINAALLMLAAIGLVIPALFAASAGKATKRSLSLEVAGALFLLYLASLVATFLRRRAAVGVLAAEAELKPSKRARAEAELAPKWGRRTALSILAGVAVALAFMSELLTGAIEPASERLGLTPIFSGVFLLALVGNAAELFNAVRFARKDQMDLSLGITMGASTQVALLVGPVLVFTGYFLGQDMNFIFSQFEIVAIGLAVLVIRALTYDGASNWLEGLMLIVLYVMLGFGFYHMPVPH